MSISKETVLSLSEKQKSQFLGSFLIIWVAINWELAFVIFSGFTTKEFTSDTLINHIKTTYPSNVWDHFLIPFITTILIAIAQPFLSLIPLYSKELSTWCKTWIIKKHRKDLYDQDQYNELEQKRTKLTEQLTTEKKYLTRETNEHELLKIKHNEISKNFDQLQKSNQLLNNEKEKFKRLSDDTKIGELSNEFLSDCSFLKNDIKKINSIVNERVWVGISKHLELNKISNGCILSTKKKYEDYVEEIKISIDSFSTRIDTVSEKLRK